MPLFRSPGTNYLFYKTKKYLRRIQSLEVDNKSPSENIVSYSFVHDGDTKKSFQEFCDFVNYDPMTARFWIYAKVEGDDSCALYYGEEDDNSMDEIQPILNIDQKIDQTNIFPNWVSLHWKRTQKDLTLVNGFKVDGKQMLFQIHEGRPPAHFAAVSDEKFDSIVLPSTWIDHQPTHYDVFTLLGRESLIVKDKFFFLANQNQLWSLRHSNPDNFNLDMKLVGNIDFKEGKPTPEVNLSTRFLFFAPAEEKDTTLVLSTDGTPSETFVIHKFNSTTSQILTQNSKVVEYKKNDGSTKYYFYFLVREHVNTDKVVDLDGVETNPKTADAATPVWKSMQFDRTFLYRCCVHECMQKEIHGTQNQEISDTWKDAQILMTNPFYPRGLFVGTPSTIVMVLDEDVIELIQVADPLKERVRLLLTSGLNVIYELCPSNLPEEETRCTIQLFFAQQQETKVLHDNVPPDSFVVNSKKDGSEVQLLFQNATGLQFETLHTDISGGCSPACVHGQCVLEDKKFVCKCEGNFAGPACSTCKGDYSGPKCDILCTPENCQHGECKKDVGCVCDNSPEKGYWTYLDDKNLCGTCKFNLDPAKGCKRGECKPNYFGNNCERYCYPPSTCSNHGTCSSEGHCLCYEDPKLGFWTGYQCEVCQNNYSPATGCTTCLPGYSGTNCSRAECYGIPASSPDVCSGRGKCVNNRCECSDREMFFGFQCERFHCFGVENESPRICSSHGACVQPDQCLCRDGWTGADCSKEISAAIVFWSSVVIVFLSGALLTACGALIWKKKYWNNANKYKRRGFSQLDNALDETQLYDMNEEIGSETEDFDTASGSDGGANYDTDDDLKHDTF